MNCVKNKMHSLKVKFVHLQIQMTKSGASVLRLNQDNLVFWHCDTVRILICWSDLTCQLLTQPIMWFGGRGYLFDWPVAGRQRRMCGENLLRNNRCTLSQNYCVSWKNLFSCKTFVFPRESLHSLAKQLRSFAKLLLSQEILHSLAVNLQSLEKLAKCLRTPKKHLGSLTKLLCSPKYFAFICQTFVFPREMLYSLTKHMCSFAKTIVLSVVPRKAKLF